MKKGQQKTMKKRTFGNRNGSKFDLPSSMRQTLSIAKIYEDKQKVRTMLNLAILFSETGQ